LLVFFSLNINKEQNRIIINIMNGSTIAIVSELLDIIEYDLIPEGNVKQVNPSTV